jgi:hypothetical protein
MKDNMQQLGKELRDVGAKDSEVDELMAIASRLSALKPQATSVRGTAFRWQTVLRPALVGASGLIVGVLLVIVAESVPPTNVLYPLQNLTDNIAVSLHPDYRATIMMKRALQVNQLVGDHADSGKILATLADYTEKANAYKSSPHADYAAFEYCKSNLEQAATAATPDVHAAITKSLESLQDA